MLSLVHQHHQVRFNHLETLANVAGIDRECHENDAPEDPRGAGNRHVVKLGLVDVLGVVVLGRGYVHLVWDRLDVGRVRLPREILLGLSRKET